MSYSLPFPSLQHLSLIRISSHLLNLVITKHYRKIGVYPGLRKNIHLPEEFIKWARFKEEVPLLVECHPLSRIFKSQILYYTMELYFVASNFMEDGNIHSSECKPVNIAAFSKFQFTPHGEIDGKKMLVKYIENIERVRKTSFVSVDLSNWYKLACDWCLENCTHNLYNLMNAKERCRTYIFSQNNLLFIHWLNCCGDEIYFKLKECSNYNIACSTYENLLNFALSNERELAIKYMWNKLTEMEKRKKAVECASFAAYAKLPDLLCSALSYMYKEDECYIYACYGLSILQCFLIWPYHEIFLHACEMALRNSTFIIHYITLFEDIMDQMTSPYFCDRYRSILLHFWFTFPIEWRCRLHQDAFAYALNNLQNIDLESFNIITSSLRENDTDFIFV